ncbi:ComF family protein [Neptuniibacter sp.]|uniref:ComF family protein n=1 Tax=Neptuniibacter sp. TaxID=1962643 RepID=UPI00261A469E|nr:ComF family protein [Neptuniibacter sp.]MCP4598080.1 ComF family protein [Neptuniibacter sp.]
MKKPIVNYRSIINQCILCRTSSSLSSGFCQSCFDDLPWLQEHCQICALPLPASNSELICANCLKKAPTFRKVTALFEYRFPIDQLISSIKYNGKAQYIGHLSRLCEEKLAHLNQFDCIIPIPMHRVSLFKRGFNQSELLASQLSKALGIPIDKNSLKKVRNTPKQMQLERKQRLRNQQGAFHCVKLSQRHVLLIDDVMTTGATLESASQALMAAGALTIEVLVIARTER